MRTRTIAAAVLALAGNTDEGDLGGAPCTDEVRGGGGIPSR